MIQVLKFGGSSVASFDPFSRVVQLIASAQRKQRTVVVVSALGGVTDALLQLSKQTITGAEDYTDQLLAVKQKHQELIAAFFSTPESVNQKLEPYWIELQHLFDGLFMLRELTPRTLDRILAFGELLSSSILAEACQYSNIPTRWLDARSCIRTNERFGVAEVKNEETEKLIRKAVSESKEQVLIVPGFIAAASSGQTTTLGRGGSDYTAAIFAAALDATVLEIWTDVSGMMTADPRICAAAKIISQLTYREAMELSHFGAKVIYPPTIQPVLKKQIPTLIKNTFAPEDPGSLITHESIPKTSGTPNLITGISSINGVSLLTLQGSGMIGVPGFSQRFFAALHQAHVNIILITQSSSEHTITIAIGEADAPAAEKSVHEAFTHEMSVGLLDTLQREDGLCIIAVVGEGMRQHTGISGKVFHTLGRNGINIRAIAQGSSEMNISAVVEMNQVRKAVNVLHEAFFENTYKQINIFIAGTGNVGSQLITLLKQQSSILQERLKIQIRLAGVLNSRKMCINESGISLDEWENCLQSGEPAHVEKFVSQISALNLRNAVFVDITANEKVSMVYEDLLRKSIPVVACNKISASSKFQRYQLLKEISAEFNVPFLYETNVGAGLPILNTIQDLINSGDRIHKIQAVLSGTLNFVFNEYKGVQSFAAVVRRAQEEGYTEPDPRLDLNGSDVMRKILILSREAGQEMEFEQVTNISFMPQSCMEGDIDSFYQSMQTHEMHFKEMYDRAAQKNCVLKYVATYFDGKASVGLEEIPADHVLYHLYGKDNIVLLYTDRYSDQPLVIKGAGAGAAVTASGVFADIMRAVKK